MRGLIYIIVFLFFFKIASAAASVEMSLYSYISTINTPIDTGVWQPCTIFLRTLIYLPVYTPMYTFLSICILVSIFCLVISVHLLLSPCERFGKLTVLERSEGSRGNIIKSQQENIDEKGRRNSKKE